jgi:hypothetical protein
MSLSFRATRVTTTIVIAATWRTSKSLAFEFAAARASESLTLESSAFGATLEAFAFKPTTFGWTCKTFAIETASRRWAVETAALVATAFGTTGETAIFATAAFKTWAHRWTWRPAPLESCVSFGATWPATFESRTVRTSRSAGPPHVLADGFRHLHEFVFAELAIIIFVELREHLGWIWRLWTAATLWAASAGGAAFAFAGLAATAGAAGAAHFAHFFFCFGPLSVV